MKKVLYFAFVLALMISACKKSEEEVVDPSNNNNNNNPTDTTTTQKPPFIAGNWNPFNGDSNYYSVDRDVRCFAVYNNDLYISGDFSNVYDYKTWTGYNYFELPKILSDSKGILKWNKSNGFFNMNLQTNLASPRILGMTIKDNKLYFVGNVYSLNGSTAKGVFSWDGTSITPFNPANNTINLQSNGSGAITSIAVFNNKIYVPSFYYSSNGSGTTHLLASYDGANWTKEGGASPHNQSQMLLCTYKNALYIAFGYEGKLYKYDGTNLTKVMELKDNSNKIYSMYVYNNELYIGGRFNKIETLNKTSIDAYSIAKYNGTSWSTLANGILEGEVHAMTEWDGKLIIGGANFGKVNDFYVANIVAWDGDKYLSVGEPISKEEGNGVNGYIYALISYNNELIIGGNFGKLKDKNGYKTAFDLVRFTKTSK